MNRKKKKTDNQGDTEEVVLEEEQQAVEEEIETREAEVEEASIMMQDMEQIENDLNSLQDDSDEHPFKANGIVVMRRFGLCSITFGPSRPERKRNVA